jgi:hypothetical protein
MVQDTLDSTLIYPFFTENNLIYTNAFRESVNSGPTAQMIELFSQVHTHTCVSIPGEASWAHSALLPPPLSAEPGSLKKSKRPFEASAEMDDAMEGVVPSKRPNVVASGEAPVASSSLSGPGGLASTSASAFTAQHSGQTSQPGYPFEVLVRMYGDSATPPSGLVGQAVEYIGVFCPAPAPSSGDLDQDVQLQGPSNDQLHQELEDDTFLGSSSHSANSLVPRLHAVAFRFLSPAFPVLQPSLAHSSVDAPLASVGFGLFPPVFQVPEAELAGFLQRTAAQRKKELAATSRQALEEIARAATNAAGSFAPFRDEILAFLSELVGRDAFCAQYLLLALMSSVVSRGDVLVGKLSVSLEGFPNGTDDKASSAAISASSHVAAATFSVQTSAKAPAQSPSPTSGDLSHFASPSVRFLSLGLSLLVPRCLLLPLSLLVLNERLVSPKKAEDSNSLRPGLLQVTNGTVTVLDETVMSVGTLNEAGLKNLQALRVAIEEQELVYEFPYFRNKFPIDVPVIKCCSAIRGKSGLLETDVAVPLSPEAARVLLEQSSSLDAVKSRTEAILSAARSNAGGFYARARAFLACARTLEVAVPAGVSAQIQDDIVEARRLDRNVTPTDLHTWMTLARLAAMSFGEIELTFDRWKWTRELEAARIARLGQLSEANHLAVNTNGSPFRTNYHPNGHLTTPGRD